MSVNESSKFKNFKKDYNEIRKFNRRNAPNNKARKKRIEEERILQEEYLKGLEDGKKEDWS